MLRALALFFTLSFCLFAGTATLMPVARMQFLDANGKPLAGGKVYTYASGTTTPLATYMDAAESTPNTNPIILDGGGFANIRVDQESSYKFIVQNNKGVVQWTQDNVTSATSAFSGTGGSSLITYSAGYSGAVPRTQTSRNLDRVSITDFHPDQSGLSDSTAALQLALNTGRDVYVPCGTYKISTVDLVLNTATNQLNGIHGEAESCVVFNGTSLTTPVIRYNNTAKVVYGSQIDNLTINYTSGAAGSGCFGYGTDGDTTFFVVKSTLRNIHCTGTYTTGDWTTSIDPNYRTATASALADLKSYGVGINIVHMFDSKIEQCTFLQNGIDIYSEGSDLNEIDNNRSQASGKFWYSLDANTFGNINWIHHNDLLINGSAGGIIELHGSYYYLIEHNYYEGYYNSSQFIQTVADRNTRIFANKINITPPVNVTINTLIQLQPERTDWVQNGNIFVSNSHLTSTQALGQCNSGSFKNSIGSNEKTNLLCVWPTDGNNNGFPVADQPMVQKAITNPLVLSYDNSTLLGGNNSSTFWWKTSSVTGHYVIDNSLTSLNWTVTLPQNQYSGANTYTFRIVARAVTAPATAFMPIDFKNATTGVTTRIFQGNVVFTNAAQSETREFNVTIPASTIPGGFVPVGSTFTFALLPTQIEIERIEIDPTVPYVYDAGNVSSSYAVQLSNPASLHKLTLTGDVSSVSLQDTLAGGALGYDGKVITFEICQDATGGWHWPVDWGNTWFQGGRVPGLAANRCYDQTFRWSMADSKFKAITGISDNKGRFESASNFHWTLDLIPDGTDGCATAAGCIEVKGLTNSVSALTSTLNISVPMYTMPPNYVIGGLRFYTAAGCSGTGILTLTGEFGSGSSTTEYSTAADVMTAGATGNYGLYAAHSPSTDGLIFTLRATGANVDQITACSIDLYGKIEILQ